MTNLDAELAAKENAWQPYRRKQQQHEQVSLQLMTHLDAARVSRIKDDFGANGNVVDLYEFLRIMKANLPPYIYEVRARAHLSTTTRARAARAPRARARRRCRASHAARSALSRAPRRRT